MIIFSIKENSQKKDPQVHFDTKIGYYFLCFFFLLITLSRFMNIFRNGAVNFCKNGICVLAIRKFIAFEMMFQKQGPLINTKIT